MSRFSVRGSLVGALSLASLLALPSARAGASLHLPLDPCPRPLGRCAPRGPAEGSPAPRSSPPPTGGAPPAKPSFLTVRIPVAAGIRRFTPRDLRLGDVVTPRSLLLALSSRLGLSSARARDWRHEAVVFVDGHRWRPGGLFGYTKPVLTRGWIRKVDVVEPPDSARPRPRAVPVSSSPARPSDPPAADPPLPPDGPSVVDVLLRRVRVSGEASVAAGFVSGAGSSDGNAEDYNLLLNVHDRRGDSLVLDFDYERSTIPFFPYAYGYGPVVFPPL